MPKFVCSYAHDIPCFVDFVVEAKSEKAALRKIRKALRKGKFQSSETEVYWENGPENERVFVQGPAKAHSTETTLEQVIGQDHVFGLYTGKCVRCGRNADEDAVQHINCHS